MRHPWNNSAYLKSFQKRSTIAQITKAMKNEVTGGLFKYSCSSFATKKVNERGCSANTTLATCTVAEQYQHLWLYCWLLFLRRHANFFFMRIRHSLFRKKTSWTTSNEKVVTDFYSFFSDVSFFSFLPGTNDQYYRKSDLWRFYLHWWPEQVFDPELISWWNYCNPWRKIEKKTSLENPDGSNWSDQKCDRKYCSKSWTNFVFLKWSYFVKKLKQWNFATVFRFF